MPETVLRQQIGELVRQYANEQQPEAFIPGQTPVPVSGKVVGALEQELMVEAALDGWLTTGRFNDQFEAALAEYTGAAHVLTVNSGSSANLVALSALTSPSLGDKAIRAGDEVITVAAGFPTTINPILQIGAVPVFVDVELTTHNVNTNLLEAARSSRTRAVMLAHTLGNPFDLDAVMDFCHRHALWLIEDCCDALGTRYKGRHVGLFGHLATLSFYPAHHITTGEGGAVFTNDATLARLACSFRDWGRDCHCRPGQDNRCGRRFTQQHGGLPHGYDHKYVYSHAGYNLKMTDMQAACGVAQMTRLPGFVQARREHFAFLSSCLADCSRWMELPQPQQQADPSWFGFLCTLKPEAPARLDLLRHLDEHSIGSRLLFAGNAARQPYMQGHTFRIAGALTNTDVVMNRSFWIGLFPGLTRDMLRYTADTLHTFLRTKDS